MSGAAQTLEILVPAGEWLSANDHRRRWDRAARAKALRARGGWLARAQGIRPVDGLVRIVATIHGRTEVRSDPNNCADTTKPLIDGLRDAGVLVDDDHLHVIGPDHRWGKPDHAMRQGSHVVVLTITPEEEP